MILILGVSFKIWRNKVNRVLRIETRDIGLIKKTKSARAKKKKEETTRLRQLVGKCLIYALLKSINVFCFLKTKHPRLLKLRQDEKKKTDEKNKKKDEEVRIKVDLFKT
jgi:hypothetical protein